MLDDLVDNFIDFGTALGDVSWSRACSEGLPRGSEELPRCALTPSRERAAQRRSSLSLQPTFKAFKKDCLGKLAPYVVYRFANVNAERLFKICSLETSFCLLSLMILKT